MEHLSQAFRGSRHEKALGIASGRSIRIIFAWRRGGRIADFSSICIEHLAFAHANRFPMEAHDRDRHRRFACQRIPRTMMDKFVNGVQRTRFHCTEKCNLASALALRSRATNGSAGVEGTSGDPAVAMTSVLDQPYNRRAGKHRVQTRSFPHR